MEEQCEVQQIANKIPNAVAESLPISNYVKIMAIWPDLVLAIEWVADQQVGQVLQWPLSSTKQVEKHALCTLSQPDNVLRQTSILGSGFCCLILVAQACWFMHLVCIRAWEFYSSFQT